MKVIISLLCSFYSIALFGQVITKDMHNDDSCAVCNCNQWHYYSEIDSETKDSKLGFIKERVNPRDCGASDAYTTYEFMVYTFFSNGKIHTQKIEKGSFTGWTRDSSGRTNIYNEIGVLKKSLIYNKDTLTTIEYDDNGKKIKRKKSKKVKIRAKY